MTVVLNDQRTKVFLDRYALKDGQGNPIEHTVEEMWDRVARGIAQGTVEEVAFRDLLEGFKFVPGGRILAGAGTNTEVTFYNCYVIPLETKVRRELRLSAATKLERQRSQDPGSDSRESILDTISVMVDIMSRGGGVGINWSTLRPKNAHLSKVNGTTSGPVSWMDVASHAVQTVTQGGSRRGAAMFMLDDWHPDVLEFIDAKRNLDKITGANVSVGISDAFMRAVKDDGDWQFEFPATTSPEYDSEWDGSLANWKKAGLPVIPYGRPVKARSVWRKIAESAWHNGEPGIVFMDRYNELSTGKGIEDIICVNPCGEQGLGAYSVCNLGAMNLDAYVVGDGISEPYKFDYASFGRDVATAIRFLDNVVDKNYYFLEDNANIQKRLRRVGLGVMGLADALIALGIRYGSPQSVDFVENVFAHMKNAAITASNYIAAEKGPAPDWNKSMLMRPYIATFLTDSPDWKETQEGLLSAGLRNIFLLTQAPTGSTSILAGVNSGIEPYFAFEYTRKDRTGTHKVMASAMDKYGGSTRDDGQWVTSNDVSVEEHIAVQAAVQRYVDSSVSKTINAPNNHTVEDVEKAYTLAYESGLKGLAYFRDGNGRDQVLYKEEPNVGGLSAAQPSVGVSDDGDALREEIASLQSTFLALEPHIFEYERPDVLVGRTSKVATRAGTAYVTVNRDEFSGRPVEVFFNVGKAGSEVASLAEALGRLASLALRKGATLGGVAHQLEGVGGATQFNKSIPHALSQALTADNNRKTEVAPEVTLTVENNEGSFEFKGNLVASEPRNGGTFDICPECQNASLSYQEGCSKCAICGFSAC